MQNSNARAEWTILYIDDDEDDYILVREALSQARAARVHLIWARSFEDGEAKLREGGYDAVLVDYRLGPRSGVELIRTFSQSHACPFILYTGHGSFEVDMEAMQAGASLYVTKGDFSPRTLERFIHYAIERKSAEEELRRLHERAAWMARFPDENPNPVARVNLKGAIIYHNRSAGRAERWALRMDEQLPGDFLPLLERVVASNELLECDLKIGERYYSVSLNPFVDDGYVNIYGREITERKLAEEALRESEERFRALVAPFVQAVWETDASGMVVKDSPSWRAYTGQTLEEWQGEGWANAIHPDERGIVLSKWHEAIRAQTPVDAEFRMKSANGRWQWTNVRATPLRGADGTVVKWVGMNVDVTERRAAEEALRRSNADLANERNRLLAVMESLPIGVSILNREGGVVSVNRGYESLWGDPISQTDTVEDYAAFQAWWVESGQAVRPEEWASAQAIEKGMTVNDQFLLIQRFDGKQVYVLNSASPIFDVNGVITGSVVAIMDVTRLVEAETALRESQDRLRVAVQSLPLAVYTCDLDLRYTWMYQAYMGYRPEAVVGKRDEELFSAENAAELNAAKQKAIQSGQGGVQEIKIQLADGDHYYLHTTDPIRDRQGNISGLTCSAIDITEQKHLEAEQREQAVQIEVHHRLLEHRERERNTIARELHDGPIQTLSAAIFQMQAIKQDYADANLMREISELQQETRRCIQELRDLMNDLRPPALLHFGFTKIVRYITEDYRARYPLIEFELNMVDDNEDGLSEATRLALFRIYQAGINNIIHHSGAGKVSVFFRIEGERFCFELQDNGVGFDPEKDLAEFIREGRFGLVGMKERAEAIGGNLEIGVGATGGVYARVNGPVKGSGN